MTPHDAERYHRQMVLPGFGKGTQAVLSNARVLVVGLGGLGAPCATALAAAGVGTLVLVDDDRVALSNLHRQTLYATSDVGRHKVEAAAEALARNAPGVAYETHVARIGGARPAPTLDGANVIVDATDSFTSRRLVATSSEAARRPLVSAAVSRLSGTLTTFVPFEGGPSLDCLHPDPPSDWEADCAEDGTLGAVTNMLGAMQAAEVLKVLLTRAGIDALGAPLIGRLLMMDAATWRVSTIRYARRRSDMQGAA